MQKLRMKLFMYNFNLNSHHESQMKVEQEKL